MSESIFQVFPDLLCLNNVVKLSVLEMETLICYPLIEVGVKQKSINV